MASLDDCGAPWATSPASLSRPSPIMGGWVGGQAAYVMVPDADGDQTARFERGHVVLAVTWGTVS
jgi:hypothetical protein